MQTAVWTVFKASILLPEVVQRLMCLIKRQQTVILGNFQSQRIQLGTMTVCISISKFLSIALSVSN